MTTALPTTASMTGSSITEAQFKSELSNLRDFLSGLIGADGTQATALAALGASLSGTLTKTAAYTVASTDRGRLLVCTGTWPLTLPSAAAVGDGFVIGLRNSGAGTITADGNSADQIDGTATLAFAAGESGFLICDGAGWSSLGRSVATDPGGGLIGIQTFTASGTYTKNASAKGIKITVTGAGGGADTNNQGHGAAGGTAIKWIDNSAVGATESVTVGTGGNGAASPTGGGSSSFGAHCSATGGAKGRGGAIFSFGGIGTGGDINISGGDGAVTTPGSSIFGTGGGAGTPRGAPGGGATWIDSAFDSDGANGIVVIEEYA